MVVRVVGLLALAAGVLLAAQFVWTLPDLTREIQEASQGNHLPLALMGTVDPEGRTGSSVLLRGLGSVALTTAGILFLRRSRSQ